MQSDVIEIDLGHDIARVELDSVERWSWTSPDAPMTTCALCKGSGKVTCEECDGKGIVECNLGHEHDCEECDEGKWTCEACDDNGETEDENAIVEIVIRYGTLWQCDVTTADGRVGSACVCDSPQDAFDAAAEDAERPRRKIQMFGKGRAA